MGRGRKGIRCFGGRHPQRGLVEVEGGAVSPGTCWSHTVSSDGESKVCNYMGAGRAG